MTPDLSSLCTLDELYDAYTQIRVLTLRFWSRASDNFADFKLEQVTHLNS